MLNEKKNVKKLNKEYVKIRKIYQLTKQNVYRWRLERQISLTTGSSERNLVVKIGQLV